MLHEKLKSHFTGEDDACADSSKHLGGPYYLERKPGEGILTIKRAVKKETAPWHDSLRNSTYNFCPDDFENISLSIEESIALMDVYSKFEGQVPELRLTTPCFMNHQNQEGYFQCPECCPDYIPEHYF
jgi:hypothetical protein